MVSSFSWDDNVRTLDSRTAIIEKFDDYDDRNESFMHGETCRAHCDCECKGQVYFPVMRKTRWAVNKRFILQVVFPRIRTLSQSSHNQRFRASELYRCSDVDLSVNLLVVHNRPVSIADCWQSHGTEMSSDGPSHRGRWHRWSNYLGRTELPAVNGSILVWRNIHSTGRRTKWRSALEKLWYNEIPSSSCSPVNYGVSPNSGRGSPQASEEFVQVGRFPDNCKFTSFAPKPLFVTFTCDNS